jgi:hypothetical protein
MMPEGFITWEQAKPIVMAIIKNGAKPQYIKIIFSADTETVNNMHNNAQALFLNMIYENNQVIFTTASSQKQFELDKSLDVNWDKWINSFFKHHNIPVHEQE